MPITCQDWRECRASSVLPLVAREARTWRAELGWNVERSWRVIEPARAAGALPGFVARDDRGRIVGWTWFLSHLDCLQVAALVADQEQTARALVAAVMASPEARRSTAQVFSVRGTPPGVAAALAAHGLEVAGYRYQMAPLDGLPAAAPVGRAWRPADLAPAAELCRRAYAAAGGVRAFAPHGTGLEWREYLQGLFGTDGCGEFQADASLVVDGGRDLAAAIVTSLIDRQVAHVSQIIVDPAEQGRGLGRRLMRRAMTAVAARGARRMTLLVAAGNESARALYAGLGFTDRAEFVVASSVQPCRSTSVALVAGGVSTRR